MAFSGCRNLSEDCAPQFLTFSINIHLVSRISSVTTQVDKEAKKPYIPVKSLCDYKNSKDRKCVYTSAKLPILVPYPKLKKVKLNVFYLHAKMQMLISLVYQKNQYADFTTFISSVNPHIGSKIYFHFDKRYYIFQIFFACVKSQSARFSISLSSQIFF